ncbi:TonB-dependent receptor [Alteromonas sediminis]|uniref:TonB-dependent receptor n=1 Tax=Alteromonas sediminis TaxID=2259342 RepID=A0A3N5Y4I9_9ALTE|nr:TonB-dependent receptor [Alteromonas sediminis]RPJ65059.1 TonB-dependent receptor [Alteromonas sediminis]
MNKPFIKNAVVSALFPLSVGFAQAETVDEQADVERIIVTADFRDSALSDVANSVSVFDQSVLERRQANHLQQVLNLAPNVNYSEGASRGRFFQIRGIGERSQFIDPVNPSVGLIIDGIDFTGLGLAASTLDIQQVEVFRGPQGTLYGANALAGLISLKSNEPSADMYSQLGIELSQYGGQVIDLVNSAAVNENLGYRVAARKQKSDGFIQNTFLGRDDTNDIDETTFRGKLNILAADDLSVELVAFYLDADNGYDAFSLRNTRVTTSDQPGTDKQRSKAAATTVTYTAPSAFSVEALVSFANTDSEYSFDEDWSNTGEFSADLFPYSSADSYQRDRNNLTADVRLISSETATLFGDNIDWVLGVYYREDNEDLLRIRFADLQFDGGFSNQFDTENLALYGQVSHHLSERFTVTTGLRLERRKADYADSVGVARDTSENAWGGKLVLEYRANPDVLVYGLVSRGYKSGGVNGQIISAAALNDAIPESTFTFETETLLNAEVGVKGAWFDGALTSQISAFYQDRKDAQVGQSIFNPEDFSFDEYLGNAPAKAHGVEIESVLRAADNVELYASVGWLNAEFGEFSSFAHVDAQSTGVAFDMNGRDIAQAPRYQFAFGSNIYFFERLWLNVEVEGKDDYFFSNTHNDKSEAYELVNMRLNYQFDQWQVSVWGRNLTDEDVQTRGFFFSNDFGNNPGNGYAPEPYYQLAEPRIFGVSASIEF